jgi:hypothetical protein
VSPEYVLITIVGSLGFIGFFAMLLRIEKLEAFRRHVESSDFYLESERKYREEQKALERIGEELGL